MTEKQRKALWLVAVVISAVFVYIGIIHPEGPEPVPWGTKDRTAEIARRKKEADEKVNLYVGVLAPAVILGACFLLTAFVKPKP